MMMQGYDKVEIQRLSGHSIDDTQFSYYDHMGNWMDAEIQKIEKELRRNTSLGPFPNDRKIENFHPKAYEFFDTQYKKAYVNSSSFEDYKEYIQLSIGLCKDKLMPCPTFNWKHSGCYFCKHWTISLEELEKKKDIIAHDLGLIYEELRSKVNFMKYLLDSQLDEFGKVHFDIKKDLSSTSQEIQLGIKQVAKLRSMLGVAIYE